MTVYILIPVHNNVDYTLHCIEALNKQTYSPLSIVIVDDGSTDNTFAFIKERHPNVTVLSGDGSLWWGGAMQYGVEHILDKAKEGDYILSLNNDVTFDKNYISTMVETSLAYGRAITGSFCREYNKGTIIDQGGCFVWKKAKDISTSELLKRSDTSDVLEGLDYLFGRGTLFPLEVFQKIGNFRGKALPHYGSDTEFTYRAKKAGFNLVLSLQAIIFNYELNKTTGIHYNENYFISISQAWHILTSVKSAYNVKKIVTFVYLCCPPEFRFRNIVKRTAAVIGATLVRTKVFYLPHRLLHSVISLIKNMKYLKFIFIPVPIPETELKKRNVDIEYLLRNNFLYKIYFMGQPYYKVVISSERIPHTNGGRDLKELTESSSRFTRKICWFWNALLKQFKEE